MPWGGKATIARRRWPSSSRWAAAARGSGLLVDADRRVVGPGAAVEHDDGEAAVLDDRPALVVEGVAVGDEAVDDGGADDVVGRVALVAGTG